MTRVGKERLINCDNGLAMSFLINWRIFIGMLYGPELLLLFNEDMHVIISVSSVGEIKNVLSLLFLRNSEKCNIH